MVLNVVLTMVLNMIFAMVLTMVLAMVRTMVKSVWSEHLVVVSVTSGLEAGLGLERQVWIVTTACCSFQFLHGISIMIMTVLPCEELSQFSFV